MSKSKNLKNVSELLTVNPRLYGNYSQKDDFIYIISEIWWNLRVPAGEGKTKNIIESLGVPDGGLVGFNFQIDPDDGETFEILEETGKFYEKSQKFVIKYHGNNFSGLSVILPAVYSAYHGKSDSQKLFEQMELTKNGFIIYDGQDIYKTFEFLERLKLTAETNEIDFNFRETDRPIDFSVLEQTEKILTENVLLTDFVEIVGKDIEWIGADKSYYLSEKVRPLIQVAKMALDEGKESFNILVSGESGVGKTTLGEVMAQHIWGENWQKHFYHADIGMFEDVTYAFYQVDVEEENGASITKGNITKLTEMMINGDCLILLNEINRPSAAVLLNAFVSILDDKKILDVGREKIKIANNIIFLATANVGYDYAGTIPIGKQLENRFNYKLHLDNPPPEKIAEVLVEKYGISDKDANKIANTVDVLRNKMFELNFYDVDLTIRSCKAIARLFKYGLSMLDAFYNVVQPDNKQENVQKAIIEIFAAHLGDVR